MNYAEKTLGLFFVYIFLVIAISAQTTAFTYQGKLTDGGSPATAQYDFTFKLYDSASGGTQVGTDHAVDDVQVTAGIFTVNLNFGTSPFTSATGNFLEISVRPGSSTGAYTLLSPRQPLTSAPYAVKSLNADNAANATNATNSANATNATTATNALNLGGVGANQYVTTSSGNASYVQNTTSPQTASFNISGTGTVGGNFVANGKVGAGVVPFFKLEVVDPSNTGLRVQTNTTGGTVASFGGSGDFQIDAPSIVGGRLAVKESGRVGIGTANPLAKLDIAGGADSDGSSNPQAISLQYRLGGFRHWIRTRHNVIPGSGNAIDFFVNNSTAATGSTGAGVGSIPALTLDSGRVGVGTTDPLFKFQVQTGTDQNFVVRPAVEFSSGLSGVAVQSVNTLNTVYMPLDIEGSQVTLNVGSGGNVGIGTPTPAERLHVVGNGRFTGNLTVNGMLNASLPTGSANYIQSTPIGTQAGASFNIDGGGNANIFNAATQYNIGGSRVLSIAGENNFFAGTGAGQNNTGSSNAFVGTNAGRFNTAGNANAFFGVNAGRNNTAGNFNAFFGASVGQSSTGSYNSFFGHGAGGQNTLGEENSFFGTGAGVNVQNGLGITLIGVRTGVPAGSNLTNATAIGVNASVSQSNSLVLGNGVNVGIGTDTPSFKLTIFDSSNTGLRVTTAGSGGTVASFGGNGAFQIDAPGVPGGRFKVTESGKVYVPQANSLILRSPNGSCFALAVNDIGQLGTSLVTCP